MAIDTIDEMGCLVWEEYYRLLAQRIGKMPKRGGHNYWDDKKYKVFRQIAQRCIEHKFDPTEYIASNFARLEKEYIYIRPEDFINFDALQRHQVHGETDAEQSWIVQVGILTDISCRCIPRFFKREIEILQDPETPFRPWFRVVYIKPFNEVLFKGFGERAWMDLREDRRLRAVSRKHSVANIEELERRLGRFGDIVIEGAPQ